MSGTQHVAVESRRKQEQGNWQLALDAHCQSCGRSSRTLSRNDAFALAAAIEHQAILVTDEWPLKWVAENFDYDDGSPIDSLLSVDVLGIFEAAGVIGATARRQTYRAWRMAGENLHPNSDRCYRNIFKEHPPHAQA